jgi:pimeloyl-ACP methyl ester carboxylesterase
VSKASHSQVPGFHKFLIDTGRGQIAGLRTDPDVGNDGLPVVVMVNGLNDKKERWLPVTRKIVRAGYNVCTYDHLGQNESDMPDCAMPYSIERMADDLLSVVDQVIQAHDSIHLVGSCFGGFIARDLVARFPHRVRSMILLGSGLSISTSCAPTFHEEVEDALAAGGEECLFDRFREIAIQAGMSHRVIERLRGSHRADFFAGFARAVAEYSVCEIAQDMPTLVVYGSVDDLWPAPTQQIMAEKLGARLAVIRGGGHSAVMTHPTATANIFLEFWQHVESRNRVPVGTP